MPGVRRGIELPTGHGELGWGKRRAVGRALRREGYDRSIVLPRSAKAALVPWFARISVRTGYRGESRYGLINDMRPLDKHAMPVMVQRYVALGLPRGADVPPPVLNPRLIAETTQWRSLCERLDLDAGARTVALMPGAEFGPAKQWPPSHFRVLADRLTDDGHQVIVLGSGKERELGAAVAGERGANLCGRTSLVDVVDLLAGCEAAVTNDSGLMHVAAAVDTRVVALYGSSSPHYTPPLTDDADVLWLRKACSPCFERTCPLGHTYCLDDIAVTDVHAAITDTGR